MSNVNKTLDFSADEDLHSSYQTVRKPPLNNQSSATLVASSVSTISYQYDNKPQNYKRGQLVGSLNFAVTTASYNRIHNLGMTLIRRAALSVPGNLVIAEIDNLHMYTRACLPMLRKLVDYLSTGANRGAGHTTAADIINVGRSYNLFRSNVALPIATPGVSTTLVAIAPNGTRIVAVSGTTVTAAKPDLGSTEMTYFSQSAISGAVRIDFAMPVCDILPMTFAAIDKSVYFGQSLQLDIDYNSVDRIGFTGTDIAVLATGIGALAATTLTNLFLNQAIERNPSVIRRLVSEVNASGMEIVVPYTYSYDNSTNAAGSSASWVRTFNSGHGDRLLAISSAVGNTVRTGGLAYDISNLSAGKVTSFESTLNSERLQSFKPSCATFEDWALMEPMLKGSVVGQSANIYQHNRVWVDSWMDSRTADWEDHLQNREDGIDLDESREYVMKYDTDATYALHMYFWVHVQRTLSIGRDGQLSWKMIR